MNQLISKLMRIAIGFLFVLPPTACAATVSSKALEGRVLEEGSNKPVANAMVVVRWIGDVGGIGHGGTVCYHVEMAVTDNQGQFRTPAWKKPSPYGDIAHPRYGRYAHVPGYVFVRADKETIYLQPFTGGREEMLKYLLRLLGNTSCGARDVSEKNLIPLRKALYDEAHKLAQTKEDQKTVETIRYSLEIIDLGFEAAEKRHLERVQK